MKKYVISFLLFTILMGNGCQRYVVVKNSDVPPVSKTNQSKFIDYAGIAKSLDKGDRIKEITMNRSFAMPSSLIDKKQITKYFQLGNFYFAVYQSGGVKENRELVPQNLEQAGVLYAKNDDKQWSIFFDLKNKSEADRNNPFYIWNEENKINILIHDLVGANRREGVAKIISSENAGKDWSIDKCFYLDWTSFDELRAKNKTDFKTTLKNYLAKVYQNNAINLEYIKNDKTGNFETTQFNPETKKNETVPVESCQNVVLPQN
jgi:hypothetical protein